MEKYNSNRNQHIKGKFVQREVYAPASTLVEFVLKISAENPVAPFSLEDITNLYAYEDADGTLMQEIYEWWIVSPFLAEKLTSYGEPVVSDGQNRYWGRCSTGQAILLDDVISRVCDDMEILVGQKNEWKG